MMDLDHLLTLEKNKWGTSLQNAIEFFSSEDIQDYETCQRCVQLIEKINPNTFQIEVNEK
jgi:hypothetical protein